MPSNQKHLTLSDYDKDTVVFDCNSDIRFYIECRSTDIPSTCSSLDRPAARAIISLLETWLGPDETNGIQPTEITWS